MLLKFKRLTKRNVEVFLAVCLFSWLLASCGSEHTQPTFEYMPNMMDQPSVKAQKTPMRSPVRGTIPQGFHPYPYALGEGEIAGKNLKNPLPLTRETALKGQAAFTTYCAVCHGPRGLGDGSVVPQFPRPPSLSSEKIRNWADGQIFHTITLGQNLMPSYASQVTPEQRWAIIHYLRVLQRANTPTPADLELLREKLKGLQEQEQP